MTEPALCPKCRHYLYCHPCNGWSRKTHALKLWRGMQLVLLRRCRCRGAA